MNKKDKNKVEANVKHDILVKANHIFDTFKKYSDGVRVLFLIHRNKEGGDTNNTKTRKVVAKDSEEFRLELIKLVDEKEREMVIPYRVYSSINPRDIKKAIRKFRYEQLDAESYGDEQYQDFYYNIKDRFIGCLMQSGSKQSSLFIFDCDSPAGHAKTLQQLAELGVQIEDQFPTKNGWHVITQPFNSTLFASVEDVTIVKDGLILLAF